MNYMRLNHDYQSTKASKKVSKLERNAQSMFPKNNPGRKSKQGNKWKTPDVEIIDIIKHDTGRNVRKRRNTQSIMMNTPKVESQEDEKK